IAIPAMAARNNRGGRRPLSGYAVAWTLASVSYEMSSSGQEPVAQGLFLTPATARLNVVLVEPKIPPNTGNVARLCAVTGSRLHLVAPLGFRIDDKDLRRAGLDYWDKVHAATWSSFDELLQSEGI